jgi:hypothetical protein
MHGAYLEQASKTKEGISISLQIKMTRGNELVKITSE